MAAIDDRLEALRREVHAIDNRVVRVETQLVEHRTQSGVQHGEQMAALREIREDLSDAGRTPRPVPDQRPRGEGVQDQPTQPRLTVTLNPGTLLAWGRVVLPLMFAGGVGGGLLRACELATTPEPAPVHSEAVLPSVAPQSAPAPDAPPNGTDAPSELIE